MEIDVESGKKLQALLESLQPCPVSIMNRQGVVVAATNPEDLGHVHPAALQVLEACAAGAPAFGWHSIRCIKLNESIIGAVELVGLPVEQMSMINMATAVSELFLEKESVHLQKARVNKDLREALTMLMGVHPKDCTSLEKSLAKFGFDASVPRTTLLLQLAPTATMTFDHNMREIIVDKRQTQYVTSMFFDQLPLYFFQKEDYILTYPEQQSAIVLCADRQKVLDSNIMSLFSICHKLEQIIQMERSLSMHAVIGNRCCCIKDYERQYEQLEMRLKAGRFLRPDQSILLGSSMVLGTIILYLGRDNRRRITGYIFGKLLAHPQRDVLLETLHTYFTCNMNSSKTAQKLFIHRNTLQQRLRHIEELTGYSAFTADGLLTLRIGLLHYSSLLYDNDLDSILPPQN